MTRQDAPHTARYILDTPDVFAGIAPTAAAAQLYRTLAATVHPDLAAARGLDPRLAVAATASLNAQWERHRNSRSTAPHVVGRRGVHLIGDRLRADRDVATYAVREPAGAAGETVIEIARHSAADPAVRSLVGIRRRLQQAGMSAFAPEIVDAGTTGRAWLVTRTPVGVVPLRSVRAALRNGLDGRDWAWIARRILMTLDAAATAHGRLDFDTVAIDPGVHGVVLSGWRGAGDDGRALADLFDALLADGIPEDRQRRFARRAQTLAPARVLAEYDLLLHHLYGERRFRPFPTEGLTAAPRTA